MDVLQQWRRRNGLTQVDAAALLGVSQPYFSLLEKGARPLTAGLRERLAASGEVGRRGGTEETFRAQLSALGYPAFAHLGRSRVKPEPGVFLLEVLARPDVDARVVEGLPWLVRRYESGLDCRWLTRQGKVRDLQNRMGFVLQVAGVSAPAALVALADLGRARLLAEATLCWDSMPAATREWMRVNRTELARYWNVLTMMRAEEVSDAG